MTQAAIPLANHPDRAKTLPTGSLLNPDAAPALSEEFRRELGNALLKYDGAMLFMSVNQIQELARDHGQDAPDKVISRILESIRNRTRSSDVCCRYHDHIVIMLSNTSIQSAHQISERLRESMAHMTFWVNKKQLHITVSIGYTGVNKGDNRESILSRADLWLSKQYQLFQNQDSCPKWDELTHFKLS